MHVIITGGSKKGLKGKVVELSEKSDGTVVKIKLDNSNGDIVRVWDDQVREHIAEPSTYWLRPHIRVRIISKSFKDGRFYNEKCIVQDVTTRGQCILKTAQGIILDNVLQRYLETVIPSVGKRVVVVYHSDRSLIGQVGKLLEYHEKTQSGLVQMETTFDMEVIFCWISQSYFRNRQFHLTTWPSSLTDYDFIALNSLQRLLPFQG